MSDLDFRPDLLGSGSVRFLRPRAERERFVGFGNAVDGQGEAGEGGDSARRAAWIAGWRGVLKAIEAAPKLELNRVDATGAPMTFGDAPRPIIQLRPLISRVNPQAANRPRSLK